MNENHTHDKELLDKVERLVNQGQPSGNRLLDDLAAMKPRAKADFQQELENRLTASLYSQQLEMKEKPALSTLTLKPETRTRKFAAIPVTLAAAIMAVLLMSTALLWGNLPPNISLNIGVAQVATMTSTSSEPTLEPLPLTDLNLTATAIIAGATQVGVSDLNLTATAIMGGIAPTVEAEPAADTSTCHMYHVDVAIANVWSHASTQSQLIETLGRGTEVCVLWNAENLEQDRNEWFAINLDPTAETPVFGYIIRFLLTPTTPEAANVPNNPNFTPPDCEYYLPTGNFSVRSEPSFNAESVWGGGSVNGRSTVCVTGFVAGIDDDYEWAMVNVQPEFPNAPVGYVRSDFIALVPESVPTTTPIELYTVGEGDTLGSVAAQFGVDMAVIVSANDLSQTDVIQVGQDLFIPLPAQPPQTYINIPYETGILELQAVVIALVDVPSGTTLTADMLGVVYFTAEVLPRNAFVDPSLLVGMTVRSSVARYQPLLADNVTDQAVEMSTPDVAALLPEGTVAISIPITSIVGDSFNPQTGAQYSIIIAGDNSQTVENAQIVYISSVDSNEIITLAVSPENAEVLVAAIEADLPLTFTESGGIASEPITTTFDVGGHVSTTSTGAAAEMQRAGMTWMHVQVDYRTGMDMVEVERIINEAHERGFRILLTIVGSVDQLGDENYLSDYAAYLNHIALLNPDAIEVWNEANLDRTWTTGDISGASYVNMLRVAYEAIKAANSDVMVISAAPAPTGAGSAYPDSVVNDDQWISEVVEAGGLEYMDCLGAHYVEGVVSPMQTDGDPRDDHFTRYFMGVLDTYWRLVRAERPICFTEFGYLTAEGYGSLDPYFSWAANTTVAEQAEWLVRAAQMSSQSGRVRLLMIWNIDFNPSVSDDSTAGYAIIRPDGNCPACDAFAVARNPNPVGQATPVANITSEVVADGRTRITFPAENVAFMGTTAPQVDVIAFLQIINSSEINAQITSLQVPIAVEANVVPDEQIQLVTQPLIRGAEMSINDGLISLLVSADEATVMSWIVQAQQAFMILPANPAENLEVGRYFQQTSNAFTGYFITIPLSVVTTTMDEMEMYQPVTIDVSLGGAHYQIEAARYWGADREQSTIIIASNNPIDAGILSWVEQGGFLVEISEAQP